MIEYGQAMLNHRLQANPWHREQGTQTRHNQTLAVQYIVYIYF